MQYSFRSKEHWYIINIALRIYMLKFNSYLYLTNQLEKNLCVQKVLVIFCPDLSSNCFE